MDADQFAELFTTFWPYLLALLGTLGAMLLRLGYVLKAKFDAWADAQIAKIESDVGQAAVRATKEEAEDIVLELSQTMVPEIRKAAADGRISPEERENLRKKALEILKKRTDLETLAKALDARGFPVGELDDWLLGLIESRVLKMKMLRGDAGEPKPEAA